MITVTSTVVAKSPGSRKAYGMMVAILAISRRAIVGWGERAETRRISV